MPGWSSVSALVGNVTGIFDPGYRFIPSATIGEKDTQTLLKNVNAALKRADNMLQKNGPVIQLDEHAVFMAENRVIHLKYVATEKSRQKLDEELSHWTGSSAEAHRMKEALRAQAADLFNTVDAYEDRVIRASQRANGIDPPAFPDEEPAPTEPENMLVEPEYTPIESELTPTPETISSSSEPIPSISRQPVVLAYIPRRPLLPSFTRTNVGLMKKIDVPVIAGLPLIEVPESAGHSVFQTKDLQFAVIQTSLDDDDPRQLREPDKKLFILNVIIRFRDKVLEIPDDEPREREEREVNLDAAMLFELHDIIQDWLAGILFEDLD